MRSVMLACRNAPEEMTVTAMAKVARMPLHQFRSEFSHHAGMTPHEFLVRARIEKAKILLKAGQSVTKCAHQLGFCSSQYFASVFRKFEGQSCSDFLRRDVMAIV
jgi:AraC-like DNA-binding protein